MKFYFAFILNAVANLYILLLLWGFSAGPANSIPVITLIAGGILLIIAPPVILFNRITGIAIGLVSSIALIPFEIGHVSSILKNDPFDFVTLLFLMPVVINIWVITSCILIITKRRINSIAIPVTNGRKVIFALIPIVLCLLYVAYLFF